MTSSERRELRYERRRERRRLKADAHQKTFDEVFTLENLVRAGKASCNGSRWKTSAINMETWLLREACVERRKLCSGKRSFKGFRSFRTVEHGKERQIDALPIQDRMSQKCLCREILTGAYARSFIYDNSASIRGKGMDFALKRLKVHLRRHYRKHGLEGGIYQFDFKSYFASLPHDKVKARARKVLKDNRLYALLCCYIDDFKHLGEIKKEGCGVGLGSEISQIIALVYTSPIDHYIKDHMGIKGYGRYMDDGYIISDSLEQLAEIQKEVHILAECLGISINARKDRITPFKHHGFSFLKMRVRLAQTGRVSMRVSRKGLKSARRKFVLLEKWVVAGQMKAEDAATSFNAWRSHAKRADSFLSLRAMETRFAGLMPKKG